MMRIVLRPADLARVRFELDPGPMVDAGLAARALQRPPAATLAHWHAATRPALGAGAGPLLALAPPTGPTCGFVQPLCRDLEASLDMIQHAPVRRIRPEIQDLLPPPTGWLRSLADGDRDARADLRVAAARMYAAGVAPVAAHLATDREADVARRSAALGASGLGSALHGLHPSVELRGQELLVRRPFTFTHRSDGLGIVLVPSPFLVDEVRVATEPGEPTVIFYPTGTPLPSRDGAASEDALARLLGGTRAAVLRAIGTGCGTVELARRVRSSPASASEHAAALRAVGLVATTRTGRGVRHWLTPLGAQLLHRAAPAGTSG
ncbi:winged helix-turn-helix domain-containing protein [Actinoplanes sp. NPDC051633]|uniref:winged helix-turn-helix domain-containing protein n=1 Tax=Actinoplanes sp. NPDC051633 TaxID=3155670 RepID=UPI003418B8F6